MTGKQWTGQLQQRPEDKSYSGVVSVWGFPFRVTVRRDWSEELPALEATIPNGDEAE